MPRSAAWSRLLRRPFRPPALDGDELGGWGLRLVDQLVDAWGTDVRDGHTLVLIQHVTSDG